MAKPNKIGGMATVIVNGETFDGPGEFTFNLGTPQRETAMTPSGPAGYIETPGEPMIEGDVYFARLQDIKAVVEGDGMTIQLDLDNGTRFILSDAWFAGSGDAVATDGRLSAKWVGKKGEMA